MAQECCFFNAELDGEEYDRVYLAEQFAAYFASFIGNGVFLDSTAELEVAAQSTANMSIQVLAGKAWINGYWFRNTDSYTLSVDVADGTLSRIDRVVVRWDNQERSIYLHIIKGTPSANPVAPPIVRDNDYYDLCLVMVRIGAGVTTITQSAITDTRSDSSVCGWVTGLIEQVDLTDLYNQFTTFFEEFQDAYTDDFTNWSAAQQSAFAYWVTTQTTAYTDYITGKEVEMNAWIATHQGDWTTEFRTWFENLQDELDQDQAAHLQNQINEHEDLINQLAHMLIKNDVTAPVELSDGKLLELSDGKVLAFSTRYAVMGHTHTKSDIVDL